MNRTQAMVCRVLVAVAAMFGEAHSLLGEVTVVGCAGLAPKSRDQWASSGYTAVAATFSTAYGQEWPLESAVNPDSGPATATPRIVNFESPCVSAFYARFDYYHFGEQSSNKIDVVNEDGALYTVGYVRRVGHERFRFEFFGGNGEVAERVSTVPNANFDVNNLGVRAEGEYIWPLEPAGWPGLEFFAGLGTRAWIRDINDTVAFDTTPLFGFQETWWTVYPYIGLEWKRMTGNCVETFVSGRLGVTAFTYEHDSSLNAPAFQPRLDITGQAEAGIRRKTLSASVFFDAITWQRSGDVFSQGAMYSYPASQLVTIGVKLGLAF
ncbi:MAG: hypothetical protein LLG00_03960 [Planctomycetaceae bacterium]|nr:hypothetical protein [Planctomycetaceae bacterium]